MKNKNMVAILFIVAGLLFLGINATGVNILIGLPGFLMVIIGILVVIKEPLHGENGYSKVNTHFAIENEKEGIHFFRFSKEGQENLKEKNTYLFSLHQITIEENIPCEINGIFSLLTLKAPEELIETWQMEAAFSIIHRGRKKVILFGSIPGLEGHSIRIQGVFSWIRIEN